jgi:hypothetical protein
VRFLYEGLLDAETSRPACALVRVYKTCPYGRLDPVRRAFADAMSEGAPIAPDAVCLSLMATTGERTAWCAVTQSKRHLAIPLTGADLSGKLPMVAALIGQLGIEQASVLRPDPARFAQGARRTYGVFHVAEAVGSAFIQDQSDFVVPYRIRSVLGFGGPLGSGELVIVLLFSKVPISAEVAEMFRLIALSVRIAATPHLDRMIFADPARQRLSEERSV